MIIANLEWTYKKRKTKHTTLHTPTMGVTINNKLINNNRTTADGKQSNSKSSGDTRDRLEPRHEISNNMVCATSKGSDQPAHTRSLIKAFASRLNIL